MTNKWLQLLEAHVEKGILGLAGLFMVYMLWTFMLNSPNKVSYSGQDLGPRELMERIKSDADQLDQAVRRATPKDTETIKYSDKLKEQYAQGIYGATPEGGPELPEELPRVASFGLPIEVPGLAESEAAENSGELVLATPLPPKQPKVRTGRSLAIESQAVIELNDGGEESVVMRGEGSSEEVTWVSVAAYFDKKAQYDEMIKAGYANYRANAYIVSQEVQRQEIFASGDYSDWQDVTPGKSMPKCELPEPQFDDQTGELINKDEIRQAFALVKANQNELMQPEFYLVEAGDFWSVPQLAGFEDDDEEDEEDSLEVEDKTKSTRTSTRSGRGGGVRTGRSGGVRTGRSGGSRSGGGGGGGGAAPARSSSGNPDREAKKQLREDLKNVRVLLGKKDYAEAARLAESIKTNAAATKGYKRKASELLKIAEHWIEVQERKEGRLSGRESKSEEEFIVNPETNEPAIWFHDTAVEPGKTYRYRMRVKLWNRYVGRTRALKDPEQAKSSVVLGEWSLPSDPVTVTPNKYFFLSGGQKPDLASFDVWTWRKGRWLRQRFDAQVGDVIGGIRQMKTGEYDSTGSEIEADIDFNTGAIVMDLRFDEPVLDRWPRNDGLFEYRDRDTIVMTYMDPVDGQVKERWQLHDSSDPKNKELKDQSW